MGKKLTNEDFFGRVNEIFNNTIDMDNYHFVNTSTKGHCKCKICGHEWDARGYTLLAGHGCRKCYDKRNSDNRKIPFAEIQQIIDNQNKQVKIIGDYIDTKHKCTAQCGKCGHIWKVKPNDLMKGHACPECANTSVEKEFIKKIQRLYGDDYDCGKIEYKGLNSIITFVCPKHGEFQKYAYNLWRKDKIECLCDECKQEIKNERLRLEKEKKELKRKLINEERERKKEEKLKKKQRIEEERGYIRRRGRIMPNDEYIRRLEEKYGKGRYEYTKTKLVNWRKKIIATCPIHGDFEKNAASFLRGHGCAKCAKRCLPYTTEEWIEIAKQKHPEFMYDNVKYKNKQTPVIVKCPIHGDISVYPNTFLRVKDPCPKCREDERKKKNSEKYWKKIENVYKGKDYTILNRKDTIQTDSIIEVKCNKHDIIFKPTVKNIYTHDCGCPQCGIELNADNLRSNIEDVKERINKIHNGKYDLSLFTEYKNTDTEVPIICPKHGIKYVTPHNLLIGQGCNECTFIERGLKIRLTQEEFLEKVKKVHLGKELDFTNSVYVRGKDKVEVICHKKHKNGREHGVFYTTPSALMQGVGCPKCNMSHMEQEIQCFLIENDIDFIPQAGKKIFDWIGKQSLDFYLPDDNIAIECQGEQHFIANFFKTKGINHAEKMLNEVKERDKRKKMLCQKNNVKLVYYLREYFVPYLSEDDLYLTNKNELIRFIKKCYEN